MSMMVDFIDPGGKLNRNKTDRNGSLKSRPRYKFNRNESYFVCKACYCRFLISQEIGITVVKIFKEVHLEEYLD